MTRSKSFRYLLFGICMIIAAPCGAAIVFSEDQTVLPGTAEVEVPVFFLGDEFFQNATVGFSVGDGGPLLGGTNVIPITGVRYQGGTLFDGQSIAPFQSFDFPSVGAQIASAPITTRDFDVRPADALTAEVLMVFTLDLSSALDGETYDLNVNAGNQTIIANSRGETVPLTFRTGTLSISAIPEPSSMLGLGIATAGWFACRRRRARQVAFNKGLGDADCSNERSQAKRSLTMLP